jgi:hypothetical protein
MPLRRGYKTNKLGSLGNNAGLMAAEARDCRASIVRDFVILRNLADLRCHIAGTETHAQFSAVQTIRRGYLVRHRTEYQTRKRTQSSPPLVFPMQQFARVAQVTCISLQWIRSTCWEFLAQLSSRLLHSVLYARRPIPNRFRSIRVRFRRTCKESLRALHRALPRQHPLCRRRYKRRRVLMRAAVCR